MQTRSAIASMLAAAVLASCAQSPAQVAATEPVRSVRFSTGAAAMAKCLQAGIENMVPIWTVSVRGEADRPRVHVHGGVDSGTVAIINLDDQRAVFRFSPNVFGTVSFADKLEAAMRVCDTP